MFECFEILKFLCLNAFCKTKANVHVRLIALQLYTNKKGSRISECCKGWAVEICIRFS